MFLNFEERLRNELEASQKKARELAFLTFLTGLFLGMLIIGIILRII